jgi:hypothetical protein
MDGLFAGNEFAAPEIGDETPPAPAAVLTETATVAGGRVTRSEPPDGYGDRLVKYIPAEVLAFFLAAAAQSGSDNTFLIVALVVAAGATPIFLYNRSPGGLRWYSIGLAVLAFCAWAVGTSASTDKLLNLDTSHAPFVLTVAAFLIPALDKTLGKVLHS